MNVVLRPASRILRPAPALLIWALACMLYGEEKPIRLRNETLLTPPRPANPVAAPAPQGVEGVSGLYLVQFTGRFDPAWQAELRAHGVEPLTYVPEDAFVSRLTGASLASVRSLPYVRWVGEFRPGHKVHSLVESWMRNLPAGETRPVGILLSPAATGPERAAVEGLFEKVEQRAGARRFGGLLRGVVHRRSLQALLASPAVLWVEPAPRLRLVDEVSSKIVAGDGGAQKLWTQSLGFDGSGVRVAVADSGIDTGDLSNLHPDIAGRVVSLFYYGDLENASDGHSHGTHVTGIIAGNGAVGETDENGFLYGLGVAPGVEIIGQRIFDDAGGFQAPPSNESLTRDAVRAGADIGSNSWGDDTQGRYDLNAAEFDGLVRDADALTPGDQQYILEFSAGNAGPGSQTMDSPAVAKNVIATGASENDRPDLLIYADGVDVVADFSSRGPCEDGRIKPDVVAPGTWIASLKSSFATDENAWAAISDNYMYQGGTSQAGPHASGAAAVFVQYYRELFGNKPSPALVKAALINSAVDMDDQFGTGPIPNNDEGWGRIDLTGLIASPTRESRFIDQTVLLHTGQVYEYRVVVLSAEEPLKFTLAYTDVPGFPGAIPALVNDLDLEVVGPDGTVYHGNQFQDGESIPNALGVDSLNNVEGVHLALPIPGEYVVRVVARNVPQDSRIDTASVDQDFALVVSGSLPGEGVSAVLLDRGAYTAPSVMRIAVLDPNAGGRPSLEVGVVSTTEPLGERITLHPGTLSIYFTGTVATVSGHATPDGRLQVAHGDTVTATYGSASKTARIDLLPPLITEVAATNVFASTSILWTTDEPATSMVYYGLTASLGQSVTNRSLELQHAVPLGRLLPERTYHYVVVSADEAGNLRTNNAGGAQFTFVSPKPKTLLLVDAYSPDLLLGSVDIPVTAYTSAIAAAGVSFDIWDHATLGAPSLEALQPYRVVVWRINDMDLYASISAAEITTLTNYLAGGGSFLMASMEALTRFGDATFNASVAHISSFEADLGAGRVSGVAGDRVCDGMLMVNDFSNYPDLSEYELGGPDFSDHLAPLPDAAPMLLEEGGGIVGVRYPRNAESESGRTVFLSFPLDAVPLTGTSPNTRAGLLRNILSFLAPGADGLGSVAFDNLRYNIPSRAVVEVGDADLAGAGRTTLHIRSATDPAGITLPLLETSKPGVFRGAVALVGASDPAGEGRVRAKDGDSVTAEFTDLPVNLLVRSTAVIDTVPPTLTTPPVADPGYESATISFETSEASDALIEFGETQLLGRSVYSAAFDTAQQVDLPALTPDHLYYYRITSRDQAGNAVSDDNGGRFYTFRTLKPVGVPWSDNLEKGAGEWAVIDTTDSAGTWLLGVPANGFQSSAHSPVNAWCSNRDGKPVDYVESFLLSPALDLSGGNKATLRFWHSYDFTMFSDSDILNGGEVLIVTNAASPITLASYTDDIIPWTQEEIDLTPYLGHVVYLAFHYVIFSFDFIPRPGWLLDDVSVNVETVVPGTLEIRDSLAQARYAITGPTSRAGKGLAYVDTNAPPGDYVVTFGPVPFYVTPAAQTNTLVSGGHVVFLGTYTFPDVNHNGMSDLWEKQFFGEVAPGRRGDVDTDGDGASDLDEFLAGTVPTDPTSRFQLSPPVALPDGSVVVAWSSVAGRQYRVLGCAALGQPWQPVTDWIDVRSSSASTVLPRDVTDGHRFFRVEVQP